jgi:hypothetical protein
LEVGLWHRLRTKTAQFGIILKREHNSRKKWHSTNIQQNHTSSLSKKKNKSSKSSIALYQRTKPNI